ncbi:MAG: flavodoxin family protein [Cetobacterium sp.]|uniref:flavodoxin family protein n=2 Tax=Cetobacterium sp. TaxID=2071632 RepID=UPI002FC8A8EB
MKSIILYSSNTGNTKKIAEVIHTTIPNSVLVNIKDNNEVNLEDYDFIVVGGWIDRATLDTTSLTLVKNIKNKKIGYFFTLGASPDSEHAKNCVDNIDKLFLENNNSIVKRYFCQGAIDPKLTAIMSSSPERKKRWEIAASHPDENDLFMAIQTFSNLI